MAALRNLCVRRDNLRTCSSCCSAGVVFPAVLADAVNVADAQVLALAKPALADVDAAVVDFGPELAAHGLAAVFAAFVPVDGAAHGC